MVDGFVEVVVFGEPVRSHAMELVYPVGVITFEPVAQEFGEQVVVAKPVRVLVDSLQEQAALLDVLQHCLPARHRGQRGRQPSTGALGDRCREQELEQLWFQAVQHVLGKEIADHLARTGHPAHQAGGVGAAAQRQRRQLQRGDPSVGRGGQRPHVTIRQQQAIDIIEQRSRLVEVETQCLTVNFDEFVAYPQFTHRQSGT